ncbi:Oidioi.mRNA.OKI2018_I69.XSR.g15552.t1.cds [Oikopleura dioica]|uniref:Oidioi.mRNA.OKI2018_I69.XSR.g15552.t1.cds n=1 Tax=Oikopleura dioica TaxID=34765 RepID=A0ABN7SDS0_OIKDI|nr:Oidioi.mRNA.OKI2018_I69.XSR.g15552.t1.cds [Oikopleura dioica]
MEDGSDEAQQRLTWLEEQTINKLQKHFKVRKNNEILASYSEEMSELKCCPLLAVQYIQLCKVDDARFHSIFQDVNGNYDHFTKCALEVENRMNYYKTASEDTAAFPLVHKRYFKRSKDREIKDQEFLGINVHIQKFTLENRVWLTTSCGAAAAHTKGFRDNGLWNIMSVAKLDTEEEFGSKMFSLTYERHCKARTAIVNLKESWGDVTSGLQQMRSGEGCLDVFISQCQVLLHNVRQSIISESDGGLVDEVKESAMKCVSHLRNARQAPDESVFLTEAKTNLFSTYSKCLEFLVFRAFSVLITDSDQQRLDNVCSQILTIATASVMTGKAFVLTYLTLISGGIPKPPGTQGTAEDSADIVEFRIEGDRQSPRVYVPVSQEILQGSNNVVFKCVPIMFNIGINERQELQDIRNKPSPLINAINSFSLNRLYHWIELHCEEQANVLLNGPFQQLAEEIRLYETMKKKKNVEIHRIAAEITRSLKGGRIINCKSGKDRTGMAVTLEQARIIRSEISIDDALYKHSLNEMRFHGLRRDNCKKNQDKYLYAFQKVQLLTFPNEYVPPKGSYGHAET